MLFNQQVGVFPILKIILINHFTHFMCCSYEVQVSVLLFTWVLLLKAESYILGGFVWCQVPLLSQNKISQNMSISLVKYGTLRLSQSQGNSFENLWYLLIRTNWTPSIWPQNNTTRVNKTFILKTKSCRTIFALNPCRMWMCSVHTPSLNTLWVFTECYVDCALTSINVS